MGVILFLEDNDSMRMHTQYLLTAEYLNEKGYIVKAYRRIDQVMEFFSKHKDEIDCIITDLNMSDEWLGEYRNESFGCILSGWVWLYRFVFPIKPDMPTVIYSGFIDELMGKIPDDQRPLLKKANIECVAKGADEGQGFVGLIEAIERVTRRR